MTGGQPLDGGLTVPRVAAQLAAEGVHPVVIVTDEPDKYPLGTEFPHGTTVHHRDELDTVQRELREIGGVSAIVYDQTCAAEKRRRRKRGRFPDPPQRVFINESGLRGLRRLLGDLELPVGGAGRDRVRPQAGDRPVELQQGFLLPQGVLPELCDGARRQPEEAQRRRGYCR